MVIESKCHYESVYLGEQGDVFLSLGRLSPRFLYAFYHMLENAISQMVLKKKTSQKLSMLISLFHYYLPLSTFGKRCCGPLFKVCHSLNILYKGFAEKYLLVIYIQSKA